jgi:toxin ParE1/3/4
LPPDVKWRTAARIDLRRIIEYISTDNPAAALALVQLIEMRADRLCDNPKMGRPGRVKGTRELIVHPSYIVVYRETPKAVTILRVIHSARRWPSRPL